MNKYRKTITAVVGAVLTWAAAVVASPWSEIQSGEWLFGAIALATALGVYAVPNDHALTDYDPGD